MAKKTAVNFSNYDFTANPDRYTVEETITIKRMMAAGEPIYLAPIEIEIEQQIENLHITRRECRPWYVGAEKITVHLTPANGELYDFLVSEIRAKHRDGVRKSRCMVIGKRGKLIRCDERNRCSECPFGRTPENREPQEISWDELEGYEAESYDTTADEVMARLGRQALIEKLKAADPRLATVFQMQQEGYDIPDIMAELNLSQRRVYDLVKKVKTIAAEVL